MNVPETVQAGCAEAGQLKDLLALHEAALANMSHGLCMTDAQQHLTLINQRFLDCSNCRRTSRASAWRWRT